MLGFSDRLFEKGGEITLTLACWLAVHVSWLYASLVARNIIVACCHH